MAGAPDALQGSGIRPLVLAAATIVAAGIGVHLNGLQAPFIFDDHPAIVDNPWIRQPWSVCRVLKAPHGTTVSGRPVLSVTFAMNYALGGLAVEGYHGVNVAIHVLAGLVLLGVVRRSLLSPVLQGRYQRSATGLSWAVALLWVVHPLHTQSVTYLVQRAESLMGLWYLASLYGAIRGSQSRRPPAWYAGAVACCALGMGTKEVMALAPLTMLLYDRTFLSGSVREAWRRRWGLHVGLACTWLVLAAVVTAGSRPQTSTVGMRSLTPLTYALTQCSVLPHYLRLAVWPHPLVIDYSDWPIAGYAPTLLPQAIVLAAVILGTVWSLRRQPAMGFIGAWFLLTLAPSSSVVPIADVAFEHRLYLPLISVAVAAVLAGHAALRGVAPRSMRRSLAVGLLLGAAAGLGAVTVMRNQDYHSEIAIWRDAARKRPRNARARNNLGVALAAEGWFEEAAVECAEAIRLKPDYAEAHYNLGVARYRQGRPEAAITAYLTALRLRPGDVQGHNNLAVVLAQQGRHDEAIAHYRIAIKAEPSDSPARQNLGHLLVRLGRPEEAADQYAEALRLQEHAARPVDNRALVNPDD